MHMVMQEGAAGFTGVQTINGVDRLCKANLIAGADIPSSGTPHCLCDVWDMCALQSCCTAYTGSMPYSSHAAFTITDTDDVSPDDCNQGKHFGILHLAENIAESCLELQYPSWVCQNLIYQCYISGISCHCSVQLASAHLLLMLWTTTFSSVSLMPGAVALVWCLGEDLSPAPDAVVAGLGWGYSLRAATSNSSTQEYMGLATIGRGNPERIHLTKSLSLQPKALLL